MGFDLSICSPPPSPHYSDLNRVQTLSNQSFAVYLINARSLVNKIDLLRAYIREFLPDILCVTETWADTSLPDAFFSLNGYQLFRSDRVRTQGGGVIIYVSDLLSSFAVSSLTDERVSAITCRVSSQNDQDLCISCVYIPPSYPLFGSMILQYLYDVTNSNCDSQIICGDFNCPGVDWSAFDGPPSSSPLIDWCMDNFLCQRVLSPTRPQSNSLLDLVFVSPTAPVSDVHVNECFGSSDHSIVSFSVDFHSNPRSSESDVFCFSKANWKLFEKCLIESSWPSFSKTSVSISDIWDQYVDIIVRAAQRAIPLRSKRAWEPRNSSCVRTALRAHRRLFRIHNESPTAFNRFRLHHSCSRLMSATKKSVFDHERYICKQMSSFSNPKPFWRYTRSRLNISTQFSSIRNESGERFTNDKDIANCYNAFFASNFNHRASSASFGVPPMLTKSTLNTVNFSPNVTHNLINTLPSSQATDGDGLCYLLIKRGGFFLAAKLSAFFSFSLACCSIPESWRKIIVTPVHKSGEKDKCSNFRPIAITSCVCRIMERIIYKNMIGFFSSQCPLRLSQHGFLPNKSVETANMVFYDFVTHNVDNGKYVDAIFLDFAKAFDSVPHLHLLKKLRSHGIAGPLFRWISDYLNDRVQVVRINRVVSDPTDVVSGVFQGSVLGPLLFLVFVDDLDSHVKSSIIIKYADDIKLAIAFHKDPSSQQRSCENLQADLNNINSWSNDYGLSLNVEKCISLHFGRSNPHYQYYVHHHPLKQASVTKDLGILVCDSLSFKEHILKLASRGNRMLGLLKKSFISRDPQIMLTLYKAYVRSVLEHCCTLWSPHKLYLKNCLEKVQKRFCCFFRSLDGLNYRSKLANLNLLSLEARRLRYQLIFLFKIFHGLCDLRAEDFFQASGRSVSHFPFCKLLIPLSKNSFRSNFFTVSVVKHWNNLTNAEQNVDSVSNFKSVVDIYFKRCGIW